MNQNKDLFMQALQKLFARSINCLYRDLHCQPIEAGDVSYRADFQFGAGRRQMVALKKLNMAANEFV